MRFSIAVLSILGAAASASASTLLGRQNIPACAGNCITTANLGGCQLTDNACLCKNQAFVTSSTACIQQSCQGDDLKNAEAAAVALCAAVGVTLTPPAASGSASGAASGASASATAPVSGSGASSSGAPRPSASGSGSGSGSAGAAAPTGAASVNSANALVGLAAMGLAALAL